MLVTVVKVEEKDLQVIIEGAKNRGEKILALSPAKIVRGIVKEYILATGK